MTERHDLFDAGDRPALPVLDFVRRREQATLAEAREPARREMEWYRSYEEVWGVLAPLGRFVRRNPWLAWTLLALGYASYALGLARHW